MALQQCTEGQLVSLSDQWNVAIGVVSPGMMQPLDPWKKITVEPCRTPCSEIYLQSMWFLAMSFYVVLCRFMSFCKTLGWTFATISWGVQFPGHPKMTAERPAWPSPGALWLGSPGAVESATDWRSLEPWLLGQRSDFFCEKWVEHETKKLIIIHHTSSYLIQWMKVIHVDQIDIDLWFSERLMICRLIHGESWWTKKVNKNMSQSSTWP